MSVSRLAHITQIGVEQMGDLADSLNGLEASKRLLELGQIAATPMVNWGTVRSSNYVRIVFSNEPIQRLQGTGQRFKQALT